MLIQQLKGSWKISAGTGTAYLGLEEIKVQRADKSEFVVNAPGEYDIAQIFLELNQSNVDGRVLNVTVLESEGLTIVYLPESPKEFTEDNLKLYEHVDVLMVPGKRADLAQQLAPPIVIPLENAAEMAKGLGQELPNPETSLKLRSPTDLPNDTEVVVLNK